MLLSTCTSLQYLFGYVTQGTGYKIKCKLRLTG